MYRIVKCECKSARNKSILLAFKLDCVFIGCDLRLQMETMIFYHRFEHKSSLTECNFRIVDSITTEMRAMQCLRCNVLCYAVADGNKN